MMTDITNFLESSGFKFYGHNRIDRPGGGLGILCRDTFKCTLEKQDSQYPLTIVYVK